MNAEKDLSFLVGEYGVQYRFQSFRTDVSGSFYGPMDAYSFFNDGGCFTLYHAVQRGEWDYYYSTAFSEDQSALLARDISEQVFKAIKKNRTLKTIFKSETKQLAVIIKKEIEEKGTLFGIKLELKKS
jgi:hypothetical protein